MTRQTTRDFTRPRHAPIVDVHPSAPLSPPRRTPSEDDIRLAAYEIYVNRVKVGLPGTQESDWFEAERRLRG
jgi:hypothetical protein